MRVVVVVVGARPNFIKVGSLMLALASAGIDERIAHTGQHYDWRAAVCRRLERVEALLGAPGRISEMT